MLKCVKSYKEKKARGKRVLNTDNEGRDYDSVTMEKIYMRKVSKGYWVVIHWTIANKKFPIIGYIISDETQLSKSTLAHNSVYFNTISGKRTLRKQRANLQH